MQPWRELGVQCKPCFSKWVCAWKEQIKVYRRHWRTFIWLSLYFYSEELQSPDKYIQRGASRGTALQL